MKKIVAFIDKTNEWVGRVSSWSVIVLALIVTFEVIMRYVFNRPSLGAFEYVKYIYAFHFMIVAGFALLHNAHANIDIFILSFLIKQTYPGSDFLFTLLLPLMRCSSILRNNFCMGIMGFQGNIMEYRCIPGISG